MFDIKEKVTKKGYATFHQGHGHPLLWTQEEIGISYHKFVDKDENRLELFTKVPDSVLIAVLRMLQGTSCVVDEGSWEMSISDNYLWYVLAEGPNGEDTLVCVSQDKKSGEIIHCTNKPARPRVIGL